MKWKIPPIDSIQYSLNPSRPRIFEHLILKKKDMHPISSFISISYRHRIKEKTQVQVIRSHAGLAMCTMLHSSRKGTTKWVYGGKSNYCDCNVACACLRAVGRCWCQRTGTRCVECWCIPFNTPAWPWRCSQAHCNVLPSLKSMTTLLGSSCRSWSGMYGVRKSERGYRFVITFEFYNKIQ